MANDKIRLNAAQVAGGKDVSTHTLASGEDIGRSTIAIYTAGVGGTPGTAADVDASNPFPVTFATAQHVIIDSVSGTVAATQSGSWDVGITGTLPAFASTPTVNLGTIGSAATDASVTETHATLNAIKFQRVVLADLNGTPLGIGGATAGYTVQEVALDASIGTIGGSWSTVSRAVALGVQTNGGAIGGLKSGAQGGLVIEGVASGTAVPVSLATLPSLAAGSNTIGKVDQGTGGASAWKVDGSAVTQPISAASLPLPSGAATSANQSTANTSLASIDGKTPSLGPVAASLAQPVITSIPSVYSAATWPVAGNIIKSGAGSVYVYEVYNSTGGAIFLLVFDSSATINANDSVAAGLRWGSASIANSATSSGSLGHTTFGVPCSTAIRVIFSSTADKYTALASQNVQVNCILYT